MIGSDTPKPFSLQAPEAVAKQYGGNKQKIAQAMQMGLIDPTAGTLAGMFIDRMRSAQAVEQQPQQTVAQQVFSPAPPPTPPTAGLGALPGGAIPPAGQPPQAPPPQQPPSQGAPPGMASGGLASLDYDTQAYSGGGIVALAGGGEADRRKELMKIVNSSKASSEDRRAAMRELNSMDNMSGPDEPSRGLADALAYTYKGPRGKDLMPNIPMGDADAFRASMDRMKEREPSFSERVGPYTGKTLMSDLPDMPDMPDIPVGDVGAFKASAAHMRDREPSFSERTGPYNGKSLFGLSPETRALRDNPNTSPLTPYRRAHPDLGSPDDIMESSKDPNISMYTADQLRDVANQRAMGDAVGSGIGAAARAIGHGIAYPFVKGAEYFNAPQGRGGDSDAPPLPDFVSPNMPNANTPAYYVYSPKDSKPVGFTNSAPGGVGGDGTRVSARVASRSSGRPFKAEDVNSTPDETQEQTQARMLKMMGYDDMPAPEHTSAEELAAQKKEDMWTALATMGFGAAASKSPYALSAFGEGAQQAMPGIQKAIAERRADTKEARKEDYAYKLARFGVKGDAMKAALGEYNRASDNKRKDMELELQDKWHRENYDAQMAQVAAQRESINKPGDMEKYAAAYKAAHPEDTTLAGMDAFIEGKTKSGLGYQMAQDARIAKATAAVDKAIGVGGPLYKDFRKLKGPAAERYRQQKIDAMTGGVGGGNVVNYGDLK